MIRKGKVFFKINYAGLVEESMEGKYRFAYDAEYQRDPSHQPISLTILKIIGFIGMCL